MPEFGPEIVAQALAACRAGAGEASGALSRTFELSCEVEAAEAAPLAESAPLAGPGLLLTWTVDQSWAVFLIPASPLLPEWAQTPSNPTEEGKLATFSQELAANCLPEPFQAAKAEIVWVENLAASLQQMQPAADAQRLPITFQAEQEKIDCSLIWPIRQPLPSAEQPHPRQQAASSKPPAATKKQASEKKALPPYARSLLRIKVPVRVTLASTKQAVTRILELGPGSIIQFEKSCEESLSLEVGEQHVAEGEAVRVGDRFGLRVTSIVRPEERFWKVDNGRRVQ